MIDARTRLTREQLEADLSNLPQHVSDLAQALLAGSKYSSRTESIYERESGLWYWLTCGTG